MEIKSTKIASEPDFLASAKWEAVNMVYTEDKKAGEFVDYTDGAGRTLTGIAAYDVTVAENPNGVVIYKGLIETSKLPTVPTSGGTYFPGLVFKA